MPERLARVVADADVLAADLLVDGDARAAMALVRAHDWLTLVATPALLDDAEAVVARLADESLATDWRAWTEAHCEVVEQPPGDHPALAAAYRGDAAHLLAFDDALRSAATGARLSRLDVSVKHPRDFARRFDAAALRQAAFD